MTQPLLLNVEYDVKDLLLLCRSLAGSRVGINLIGSIIEVYGIEQASIQRHDDVAQNGMV